jgi:hypothetical protein
LADDWLAGQYRIAAEAIDAQLLNDPLPDGSPGDRGPTLVGLPSGRAAGLGPGAGGRR